MLEGKRCALVTGAASGMGKAMTIALLKHGAEVIAVDRAREGLQRLREIDGAEHADRLVPMQADLSLRSDVEALLAAPALASRDVDILVNNAGIGQAVVWQDNWKNPIKVWEIGCNEWELFFRINTHAPFLLMRGLIPGMVRRGWGRIVNVTTSLETMKRKGFAPYGPSKAAFESCSAIAAAELEGTGVTVNVLVPGGLTNTGFVPEQAPFDRAEMLQPEVMVPPLLWLISEEARNTTAKRFVAAKWAQGRERACSEIAWSSGEGAILPQRKG